MPSKGIAAICSIFLTSPFLFAGQPGNAKTAVPAGSTARVPISEVPDLCLRAPALCSAPYQITDSPSSSDNEVPPLTMTAGAAIAQAKAQSGGQQQQPASENQPTLEGLGFPSSAIQGSAKEQALLNKRSHMLQIHQKLGLITAVPMGISLFTGPGAKGHHGLPGSPSGRNLHAALGGVTAGLYIATAYYAIRAPKIQGTEPRGLIRLHRALAWVHGPGMIITPILGAIAYSQLSNGERIHGVAKYHSVAAVTTFGAYMAALLSVSLK